ncbi:hypothetical protein SO802_012284 [Lithocarpus litseifolius]|uniref:DCD domain-containing protein n=1 Tax=Lithocarpus litseifolius TaxID=425828 RepID=A0AAW2D4S8_9ROSI
MTAKDIHVPNIGPSFVSTMMINASYAPLYDPTSVIPTSSAFTYPTTSHRADEGINKEKESGESSSGYIFMCNAKTKPECYRYRVFALPMGKLEVVKNIKPGTKLFLFDFDLKLLYGIYNATSNGEKDLEPTAFDGKFPAQVRFNILKDCLPLPLSAFKPAIKDNFLSGFKFRQELSSKQVETLISLFRPITVPPPISAAPPFSNVGSSHSFPAPIMEQGFQPSKRLPPPEESYISGLHYGHALPVHDRSKQVVPSPHFNHNELGTRVAWVQSPVQPYQVVQQPAFPHHHPAEPHQPYLPEKPFISLQNACRRYAGVPDMVPGDQVVGYGSQCQMSQMPRGSEIVPHSDYYRHHPSHTAAPGLSQVNALTPSHALPPPAQSQENLASSYQPNYAVSVLNLLEAHLPVNSSHSLAGATRTYP